jgi:hypothetical protein
MVVLHRSYGRTVRDQQADQKGQSETGKHPHIHRTSLFTHWNKRRASIYCRMVATIA